MSIGSPLRASRINGEEGGMVTVLVVLLVLMLFGALPVWPYSAQWSYYPSGGLGLLVLILLIVLLAGRGRMRRI